MGKTVFVIGATGFLGKVWLTMLLSQVQTFKKMYILIRGKGSMSGRERFEQLINSSYVFEHLHQKFKYELIHYLREKIEIVEGDVSKPNLGIPDEFAETLVKEIDLVVNFAGLVDFNPDLREAFSINVEGAMHAADFARKCKQKKLVHISTCYVAGTREGVIDEKILINQTPNRQVFNIEEELQWIDSNIESTFQDHESEEQIQAVRKTIETRNVELNKKPFSEKRTNKTIENMKRKKLRENMTKLGMNRAKSLGWTNTYTYTKAMAEVVLKQHYIDVDVVIFRPSIVESSLSFPFPGWNEGFNTSGPLAYLMKTWFRHLPLRQGNPFDVIPVDFVSRGLTIACAALLDDVHLEVYHCATSDINRITIDQACRFTSENHSEFYKQHGKDWKEKWILSRWETIPSKKDHLLSTPNMKKFFTGLERALSKSGMFKPLLKKVHAWSLKTNRKLEQTEKLLELFYPFIHDYRHVFSTRALFQYDIKEKEFEFSIRQIPWEDYWKNVQMPGLRKWCFPVIEGKTIEKYKTTTPFSFSGNASNGHHANGKVHPVKMDSDHEKIQAGLISSEIMAEKKVLE